MKLLQGVIRLKGYEVYKRVLNLLGYVNNDDTFTSDTALYKRALHVINQVLIDLKQKEIEDMNCELFISDDCREALIYGVAMMLSLIGGDGNMNHIFTEIYNSKRAAALNETSVIADTLPIPSEGED